jgi:hypothetical protein
MVRRHLGSQHKRRSAEERKRESLFTYALKSLRSFTLFNILWWIKLEEG